MAGGRATMDFLAAQVAARRRTALLVAWFALAWAGTVALVWAALALALAAGGLDVVGRGVVTAPGFVGAIAALVTLVTAAGSLWHGVRLARDGPRAIADLLGGAAVARDTGDPAERRLVNVVEEMAIASGLPVPALYVLPAEDGINAFAAGFTPDRAVVVVTKGALARLERDELQGVVAHEFSHLLNADAKLNLRLVALVGGITVIALAGRTLARGPSEIERDMDVTPSLRGGGGRLRVGVVLTGLAIWAAGSIGAFFGRVIRAAVCRQRELLADAAAVQLTRNPHGLAGALWKISRQGSALASPAAPEVSHFFFANGLRTSWLATHPPIAERIRRIAPDFVARRAREAVAEALAGPPAPSAWPEGAATPGHAAALASLAAAHVATAEVEPGAGQLAHAMGLLAALPPDVAVAARAPSAAPALVRALLVDAAPAAQLAAVGDPSVRAEVARLASAVAAAGREERMAILELALPALDGLGRDAAAALVADLGAIAAADGATSVFEWAVSRIVRRRLSRALGEPRRAGPRARHVGDVSVEALEVLSVLAWLGARDEPGAQAALDAGAAALGVRGWRPLPKESVRAARLDAALARLDGAIPALKARLLDACAACALADGRVVSAEGEVVRAVAASLGVPVPPLRTPAARVAGVA